MPAKRPGLFIVLLYLLSTYVLVALVRRGIYLSLTLSETGFFEITGAVGFAVAAVLLVVAFFRYSALRSQAAYTRAKHLSFLVLALILFVMAGEELSWGQHFFNFQTPDALGNVNQQNEINLHNLFIALPEGWRVFSEETILVSIWASRLFNLFWLVFAVMVPATAMLIDPARDRLDKLLPIIPSGVGLLFGANYVFFRIGILAISTGRLTGANEVKESNFGVLFAVAGAIILSALPGPASASITAGQREATVASRQTR